jgi:hypothetical protein
MAEIGEYFSAHYMTVSRAVPCANLKALNKKCRNVKTDPMFPFLFPPFRAMDGF